MGSTGGSQAWKEGLREAEGRGRASWIGGGGQGQGEGERDNVSKPQEGK
jgi:hypothetical protein